MYRLEVSPAADRDLDKLKQRISRQDFERLRVAIGGLASEPRPQGVRKIRGEERTFRIRALARTAVTLIANTVVEPAAMSVPSAHNHN